MTETTPSLEKAPETVRYLTIAWVIMLSGELARQMLDVTMALVDPSALKANAKQAAERMNEPPPESVVTFSAYASIILVAFIGLAFLAVLAAALTMYAKRKKRADTARRLLMFFSGYFALRMLMVFMVAPAASIPMALFGLSGVVQIIVGTSGICGILFATQDEARKWPAREQTFTDSGLTH